MTIEHVDAGRLHDYLDGELSAAERERVEDHARACAACAARLADLAELRTALDTLPGEARPARDLWGDIRRRITADADVVPLPVERVAEAREAEATGPERPGAVPQGWRRTVTIPLPVAWAAGLALALLTGGTLWNAAGSGSGADGLEAPVASLPVPDEAPLEASLETRRMAADGGYGPAIVDLEELLEAGRDRLSPATLRTLEESLATVEQAIAEAEAALEADPGSDLLQAMLRSHRRNKYRVLSHAASQLLPRS